MLPGILGLGIGLAMSTAPITTTAIHEVPASRLGVASALPNISRYTGGALGAALLGAILSANLSSGLERSLGRVAPAGRELVADGFRSALLVAAAFLLLAALAASRMPRLDSHEPVVTAPPAALARRAGARGEGRRLPGAGARHPAPHRARGGAGVLVGVALRLAAPVPGPVRRARARRRAHPAHRPRRRGAGAGPAGAGRHGRGAARPRPRSRRVACAWPSGPGSPGASRSGSGPVPLAALEREVADLRGLLAGEERPHAEGGRPVRDMPVAGAQGAGVVPFYVSCRGERAQALARRVGDGAMTGIFYPGGVGRLREAIGPGLPLVVHAVGGGRRRRRAARLAAPARRRRARRGGRLPRLRRAALAPRRPRPGAARPGGRLRRRRRRRPPGRAPPPGPAPRPPRRADPAAGRAGRDGRERGPLLAGRHRRTSCASARRRSRPTASPSWRCSRAATCRTACAGSPARCWANLGGWTAPRSPRCSPTGASPPTAPARPPRPSARAPTGWDEVTTLPAALRRRLADALPFWALSPDARAVSTDGTVKWGLRAADGARRRGGARSPTPPGAGRSACRARPAARWAAGSARPARWGRAAT